MERFCVIGSPISHSRSPAMHNAWFIALGIDARYEAVEVLPENLKDFMAIFADVYAGMNVTIPHKETVMKYLDEVDDCARTIGAVNTVVVDGGKLIGYNTDWSGFTQALLEGVKTHVADFDGAFLTHKPVLVVGAGGAARAICFALKQLGAVLYITNRTHEKAQKLAADFNGHALHTDELSKIQPLLVVNVTSVGMAPNENESPIPAEIWSVWKVVLSELDTAVSCRRGRFCSSSVKQFSFDCVYNPLQTQFLKDSEASGFKSITGDTMLIHQGAQAFELFTRESPPIMAMSAAASL